jgi:type III secretion protein K
MIAPAHALLVFNQLPSRSLHPSRIPAVVQAALARLQGVPAALDAWHRHWSAQILRERELTDRPVPSVARPELTLALLSSADLCLLAQRIGTVLCAPRLRATIAGSEVRAVADALSPDLLQLARVDAAGIHPGLADSRRWDLARTFESIDVLGRGALLAALRPAGQALALRAELKLPDSPVRDAPLAPADALALALRLAPRN